ncbi:hypothetical protein [Streptomyces sp. NPDC058240]|uniref:hypothetical protein n=1 Tax=Streptomyces sp. NPDC058240 TaxID=3346396 RepID=UPI0036EC2139
MTAPFIAPAMRSQVMGVPAYRIVVGVIPGTTSRARPKPTSMGREPVMRSTASALAASMRAAVAGASRLSRTATISGLPPPGGVQSSVVTFAP